MDAWVPADAEQIYGSVDNLAAHRATDVLLVALAHPRWEFLFQPTAAAHLNLIEPWWKILRSLALKGRRFETWEDVCQAVEAATADWNQHRHPFKWGERKRHRRRQQGTTPVLQFWNHRFRRQPARHPGIAVVPKVA